MVSLLIVVPTLNSHLLLPKLVSSLRLQSFTNWKLVFIDGFSNRDHVDWLDECCEVDNRFTLIQQYSSESGIFGAMNQGFSYASENDWLLFWGSDDWAPASDVFSQLIQVIQSQDFPPDMIVCRARYVDICTNVLARSSSFQPSCTLTVEAYRRLLFFGLTPPHQATLIGPGARARLARYADGFRLSADLDYFLQLSRFPDLRVQSLDLELVHMSSGGISGQQTQRRLKEVRHAYQRAFGWFWWFPFIARYVRRIFSLQGARC